MTDLCAPFSICFQIANQKQGDALNFKVLLSQVVGWTDFSENLRSSLFYDDPSNEPTFGQIHLAGHYL
jgi:hypothetical protein